MIHIVTTTINYPMNFYTIVREINSTLLDEPIKIIIGGDNRTPNLTDFCRMLKKIAINPELEIEWFGVREQCGWIANYTSDPKKYAPTVMPDNSIQRRNIVYLKSISENPSMIISIDDDNYPQQNAQQWVDSFNNGPAITKIPCIYKTESGWYNTAIHIKSDNYSDYKYLHRGMPSFVNVINSMSIKQDYSIIDNIGVHAGLWIGEPDISAIQRYGGIYPLADYCDMHYNATLASNIWAPFNTQNTAFFPNVYKYMFLPPMHDKYIEDVAWWDDIWMSYIMRKCMIADGNNFIFGYPLTWQVRNLHDLKRDYREYTKGLFITDIMVKILRDLRQDISYLDIADAFDDAGKLNSYFNQLAERMYIWMEFYNIIKGYMNETME